MNELKCCPFCGSKAKVNYDDLDHHYYTNCSNDACSRKYGYSDKEQSIKAWNTRAEVKNER